MFLPKYNLKSNVFFSWWRFQTFIKLRQDFPEKIQKVKIPTSIAEKPLSYIYVKDVARFIASISIEKSGHLFHNEFLNFASSDEVNLKTIIETISNETWSSIIEICDCCQESTPSDMETFLREKPQHEFACMQLFYPTVTPVAPIDCSKLKAKMPDFKFTPLQQAIDGTKLFFKEAEQQQHREKFMKMAKFLISDLCDSGLAIDNDYSRLFKLIFGSNS